MKKILLVSGCSWGDSNFTSTFHPEMACDWPKWPELLAKKLDMECLNLCRSGAGQEYIYGAISDKIQTLDSNKIGYTIAAWSTAPRRDFNIFSTWRNESKDSKGDINYWIQRSFRYQYAFQTLMEFKKIPYLQFQMTSLHKAYLHKLMTPYSSNLYSSKNHAKDIDLKKIQEVEPTLKSKFDKELQKILQTIKNSPYYKNFNDKFVGWPTDENIGGFDIGSKLLNEQHRISELDLHPNTKGQEVIAEFLYEKIINS